MNHKQRRAQKRRADNVKKGLTPSGKITPSKFARRKSAMLKERAMNNVAEAKAKQQDFDVTVGLPREISRHVLIEFEKGRKSGKQTLKQYSDALMQSYKLWVVVRGMTQDPKTGTTDAKIVLTEKDLVSFGSRKMFNIPTRHLVTKGKDALEVFFDIAVWPDEKDGTITVYTSRSPRKVAERLGIHKDGRKYYVPLIAFAVDTRYLREKAKQSNKSYSGYKVANNILAFRNMLYLVVISDRSPGTADIDATSKSVAWKGQINKLGGQILSRDSIEKITTLTKMTQLKIERFLKALGLVAKTQTTVIHPKPPGMSTAEHEMSFRESGNAPKHYKVLADGSIMTQGPNRFTFQGRTTGRRCAFGIPRSEPNTQVTSDNNEWKYDRYSRPTPWCTVHSLIDTDVKHKWNDRRKAALLMGISFTEHGQMVEVYTMSDAMPSRSKHADTHAGIPRKLWVNSFTSLEEMEKMYGGSGIIYQNNRPMPKKSKNVVS